MIDNVVKFLQKQKWSIRNKIGLAFSLILGCFILNGLISVLLFFTIQTTQENQTENVLNLALLQRYASAFKNEQTLYSDAIFVTNSKYLRDNFKGDITLGLHQAEQKTSTNATTQEFNNRFTNLYQAASDRFAELEVLITTGSFDKALIKWQSYTADFTNVTKLLESRQQQLEAERVTWNAQVNAAILQANILLITLTLFSLALGLTMLFLVQRVIVQPLNRLQTGLTLMADGKFNQQLQICNKDEVGKLAQSFETALKSLKHVLTGVQIGTNLQTVTTYLATATQEQAAGSVEQSRELLEVMSAIQELGQTAGQIADTSIEVVELTSTTLNQIKQVAQAEETSKVCVGQMIGIMEDTMSSIEYMERQMGMSIELMSELDIKAKSISKIVVLISTIAQEVHLLALNAAIEAAGAGRYGERFAVVAHAIKQLAGRTSQAATEAAKLTGEVQSSSQAVLAQVEQEQAEIVARVAANQKMKHSLAELEQSADHVAGAVSALINLARQVSDSANRIKQATSIQHTSNARIIESVQLVGNVSEQTASIARQIASSSSELARLTNQLNGVLGQVQLAA